MQALSPVDPCTGPHTFPLILGIKNARKHGSMQHGFRRALAPEPFFNPGRIETLWDGASDSCLYKEKELE